MESGVGMMTLLEDEFSMALEDLEQESATAAAASRQVSMATGKAAFPLIEKLARKLEEKLPWLQIRVYMIENHFFGEEITVCGLVTGKDLTQQLAGQVLGEELLIPAVMLRHEQDCFLDDMTVEEAENLLGVPISPVPNDGFRLVKAMMGISV